MRGLITTLLVCFLFQTTYALSAKQCHKDASRKMSAFFSTLDLSEEQKNKIKQIKKAELTNAKPDWKKVKQLKKDIKSLSLQANYDEKKMNQMVDKKYQLIATLKKNKLKMRRDIANILNAEQKDKYNALLKQNPHGKCHR